MVIERAGEGVGERRSVAPVDFRAFFTASHERMVRSLSLALGDDQLGCDAAAEGFARGLARWPRVSVMENPAGWVYRVGLNWGRSRRRRVRRETTVERLDEVADANRADLAGNVTLRRALDLLSDDHRDVVVARYYLDWSEAHIADALGIRPGTVKSRLSRALAQLESELEDDAVSPSRPSGPSSVSNSSVSNSSVSNSGAATSMHPTPDPNGAS